MRPVAHGGTRDPARARRRLAAPPAVRPRPLTPPSTNLSSSSSVADEPPLLLLHARVVLRRLAVPPTNRHPLSGQPTAGDLEPGKSFKP